MELSGGKRYRNQFCHWSGERENDGVSCEYMDMNQMWFQMLV